MTGDVHKSVAEPVEQFKEYHNMENQRPLLGFVLGSEYPLHRYQAASNLPQGRCLIPDDFTVEDCHRLFEQHEECGGDFIWSGSAFGGIPWLEAALGCPIVANYATGSISSRSPGGFVGPASIPRFSVNAPWIVKTKEFLEKMAEGSRGTWPIGTTRMRGIADLLAALYGGEYFIFAMIEKGDEVREVCKRVTDFWISFGKFQLELIPLFYGGIGSFYYNMWAPPDTVWHQEDATALLSPDLYEEFILPWDQLIVESFSGCVVHQHSTGYIPTQHYISMGAIALEMHIDKGGPSARELCDIYHVILKDCPLLIWGDISEKDME